MLKPHDQSGDNGAPPQGNAPVLVATLTYAEPGPQDKVLVFPVSEDCKARMAFKGCVDQETIDIFVIWLNVRKVAFPMKDAPKLAQPETVAM